MSEQNQKNRYLVDYKGYQFEFDALRNPTVEEIHQLYLDEINKRPNYSDTLRMPTLDMGSVETEEDKSDRTIKEQEGYMSENMPVDAGTLGRFGRNFWAQMPFASSTEFTPAETSLELWGETLGSITGGIAGYLTGSRIVGGVTKIAAPAFLTKQSTLISGLMNQARTAKKAGDTNELYKIGSRIRLENAKYQKMINQAEKVGYGKNPQLAAISKTGLLGKSKTYQDAILKISNKNPGHAKALDRFVNNLGGMNLYAQTKVQSASDIKRDGLSLEGRLERITDESIAASVFSVAGLPRMYGYQSKGVKYAVEPSMVFAAGAFSDLGRNEEITTEQRLINGAIFTGFHYAKELLPKRQIKEKVKDAIATVEPTINNQQLNKLVGSKGMDRILEATIKEAFKNPTYTNRKNTNKQVQILRIETPKEGKTEKHRVVIADLGTGEITAITGNSKVDALNNLDKKYSRNVPSIRDTSKGKALTTDEKNKMKNLNDSKSRLEQAIVSNRKIEAFPLPKNVVETEIINPVQKGEYKSSQALPRDYKQPKQVKEKQNAFEVGDYVKIPSYNQDTGKIDYEKSSVGVYVGKLGEFTKTEKQDIILPEWMKDTPKGLAGYNDVAVFDIQTHGGSRSARIGFGSGLIEKQKQEIVKANTVDIPALEYAEENPEFRKLVDNPIVSVSYREKPLSSDPDERFVQQIAGRETEQIANYNINSPIFKELLVEKLRGGAKNKVSVDVKRTVSKAPSQQDLQQLALDQGFSNTKKSKERLRAGKFSMGSGGTEIENMQGVIDNVTYYARQWEANVGGAFGAKTKKPFTTAQFTQIYQNAVSLGYKGKPSELYRDYKTGGKIYQKNTSTDIEETVPYFFYSPTKLKQIKLSDGTKAFPDGVVTPRLAQVLEQDRERIIVNRLGQERDNERQKFAFYKGANPDEYPSFNNMDKKAPLADDVYENYPQLNPENELAWGLKMMWDNRKGNQIEQKAVQSNIRFKTKEEAEKFGSDYWLDTEMIEKAIMQYGDQINLIKGPEQAMWDKQRRQLKIAQRNAKLPDNEYKEFLRVLFPESGGTSDNMTFDELQSATFLLSNDGYSDEYTNYLSSITPPVDIPIKFNSAYSKLTQQTMPIYTTLQMTDSKSANELSYKLINHDLMRQRLTGTFTDFKTQLVNTFDINRKDFKQLSTLIEPKFKDFYPTSMDETLQNQETIINTINDFFDKTVVMMIDAGVPVKNLESNKFEPFFEIYHNGKQIELATGYDAVRIVKGIKFRDSLENTNKPAGLDQDLKNMMKMKGKGKEFVKIKNVDDNREWLGKDFPVTMNYIEGLKRLNQDTGKYEGGWFIVDKTRYEISWSDADNFTVTRLAPNVVEQKGVEGADRFVVFTNKSGEVGKFDTHIRQNYLPRVISDDFLKALKDKNFERELTSYISQNEPSIVRANNSPQEKLELARGFKKKISQVYASDSAVHGTQHTRVANLPPVYLLEQGTGKIIPVKNYRDSQDNPVSVGSTVLDSNGVFRKVGKIVDVYERDFDKILARYGQGVAHVAPTSQLFGHKGVNSESVSGKGGLLDRIESETNSQFAQYSKRVTELQLNSLSRSDFERLINQLTNVTAQTGLSSPVSGAKNFILGQGAIAQSLGFRLLSNAWVRALSNPKAMSTLTGRIGGKDAGVHELVTGAISYNKLNPGLMYYTELVNRITGVAVGEPALLSSIDNLNGQKGFLNIGVSKETSMNILKDFFKLSDDDIEDAIRLGSSRIHERPDIIERALQLGHLITQGGPNLPFVPPVFAKPLIKPLTLFYRIVMRVTENLSNFAMKPLIIDGNPFGLLRTAAIALYGGEAISALYYHATGSDIVNRFKSKSGQIFDTLLAGEMFAIFTGMLDEDRGFTESYFPVVVDNVLSAGTNILAVAQGKKTPSQAGSDFTKDFVSIYGQAMKKWEQSAKPSLAAYKKSKRRQRQFEDRYFRQDKSRSKNELSNLTINSPEYRMVREVFWTDGITEDKARVYSSVIANVANQIEQNGFSKGISTKNATKQAKTNVKTIVKSQRPIPTSWRKKNKGKKTKYDLYIQALKEIDIRNNKTFAKDELEIEKIYQQRMREWNASISKHRKYMFTPLPEIGKKPQKRKIKPIGTPVQLPDNY